MHPFIDLFGRQIGTYGLCMAVAVLLVGTISILRGKKQGVVPEDILIVGACAISGALICGSALYIFITYSLEQIWQMIASGRIEELLGSGIVFYGGLIGGIFGALLGTKIAKCRLSSLEYAVVPFIPLGHAIGRVGCVFAGCCYGMEYDGFCALYYPHSVAGLSPDQGYFPTQLLEALLNCIICVCLVLLARRRRKPYDILFAYLGMYSLARFLLEFTRGDSIRGIYFGVSSSQWISLGLAAAVVIRALWLRKKQAAA